jgi:uncharacterized protein (TIGR04255 family)
LKKAPVVETRMMVQFAPLNAFRSGHFGLLWTECFGREEWVIRPDADLQPHLVERFDSLFLNPPVEPANVDATPSRMVLASPDGQRLSQFQPDQLSMTFRRFSVDCPTYEQVREQFGQVIGKVERFAEDHKVGPFAPDLWELTYVNVIPQGDLWQTPADWSKVFPSLFPPSPPDVAGCQWTSFEGEWHLIIPPEFGRVHVRAAKSVANQSKQVVLLIVLTVRGPVGGSGAKTWEAGLDAAHATAVQVFYNLASQTAKDYWEVER